MTLRSRLTALLLAVVAAPSLLGAAALTAAGSLDGAPLAALWVVALGVSAASVVGVRVAVDRWALGPVASVVEAAEEVAAGRLEGVGPIQGAATAEVQDLVRAFDAMVRTMRRQVADVEQSRVGFRRAIDRLGDALESTHDRETIIDVLTEAAQLTVGAAAAVFWVASGRGLVLRAAHGVEPSPGAALTRGEGVAGAAALDDRELLAPGMARPAPAEPPYEDAVAVPMRRKGGLYGVLALYGRAPGRPFTAEDARTVATLARQASAAVDNSYLHEEASRLSLTDGLTGAWNRRHLELRIRQEIERAARFGDPFSLVMVDLDRFKEVNDRYGHQVGDAALVELTRRLHRVTREVDSIARYGGEEFVIVLPKTGTDGGVALGEKVRGAVADEPFVLDGVELSMSVSVGVATHPDHGADARATLGAADRAMYGAKAAGRDRVLAAGGEEQEPTAGSVADRATEETP